MPANNGFSIRHTTRNFPNREGSKPGQGQISLVSLMDARSIAATAANGGVLTAATDIEYEDTHKPYTFDDRIYKSRPLHRRHCGERRRAHRCDGHRVRRHP